MSQHFRQSQPISAPRGEKRIGSHHARHVYSLTWRPRTTEAGATRRRTESRALCRTTRRRCQRQGREQGKFRRRREPGLRGSWRRRRGTSKHGTPGESRCQPLMLGAVVGIRFRRVLRSVKLAYRLVARRAIAESDGHSPAGPAESGVVFGELRHRASLRHGASASEIEMSRGVFAGRPHSIERHRAPENVSSDLFSRCGHGAYSHGRPGL